MIRRIKLESKDLEYDLGTMSSENMKRIYKSALDVLSKKDDENFNYSNGINRELILKDAHTIKYVLNKYYTEFLI